jgi:membrane fusion protein, hemolysin D
LKERVDIRETLLGRELGSKLNYLDGYQSLVELESELAVQASGKEEAAVSVSAAIEARVQVDVEWRRGLYADLVEARRKAAGLSQDVAKAKAPR